MLAGFRGEWPNVKTTVAEFRYCPKSMPGALCCVNRQQCGKFLRLKRGKSMKAYFAFVLAILLAIGLTPSPVYAQKSKTCPGGLAACLERCRASGGQPRLCPDFCRKQRGC